MLCNSYTFSCIIKKPHNNKRTYLIERSINNARPSVLKPVLFSFIILYLQQQSKMNMVTLSILYMIWTHLDPIPMKKLFISNLSWYTLIIIPYDTWTLRFKARLKLTFYPVVTHYGYYETYKINENYNI